MTYAFDVDSSSGECRPVIVGPIETMSISGYGFLNRPHSRPASIIEIFSVLFNQALIGLAVPQMHHRRIGVRLPARICAFRFGFRASQFTQRIQHAHHVVFLPLSIRERIGSEFLRYCRSWSPHRRWGGFNHTLPRRNCGSHRSGWRSADE